jgi:hypothetical protein
MKFSACFLALGLFFTPPGVSAQSPAAQDHSVPSHQLPPFSGTWILNMKRSKIESPPPGSGQAIIEYDGRIWKYTHKHFNSSGQVTDTWSVRLVVGSPTLHVEREEPLVFRSRIARAGDALVMTEYVTVANGQRAKNITRYTLEDNGNTLIEAEKGQGPLGIETNRWVLERKAEN